MIVAFKLYIGLVDVWKAAISLVYSI